MLTRRALLITSAIGVGAVWSNSTFAQDQPSPKEMGFEQGDPAGDKDPVFYDPDYVTELLSTARIQIQIPDPIPDFPTKLVNTANDFVGMDRWKNEKEISAMLSLFGCPFKDPQTGKYVAFCAAGIGYCAALTFANATKMATDNATLQKLLPAVDYFNYFPHPAVLNMSLVARGKSRWVSADKKQIPQKGWLVVYDWSGSPDPEKTSHTGIVIGADKNTLHTLEFNTGNQEHPKGGVIRYRDDKKLDQTVKGVH